jgi:hypothetical protein
MKTSIAKHFIPAGILSLLLAACYPLHFDRLPGDRHERIPWNLRGEYRRIPSGSKDKTMHVRVDEYSIYMQGTPVNQSRFIHYDDAIDDSSRADTMKLNRDFQVTQFGRNLYAIGAIDTMENGKTAWTMQVIRDAGRQLYTYGFYEGLQEDALDKVLKSHIRDDDSSKTYTMDDAVFADFCTHNLRKKDAIRWQRIK